MSFYEAYLGHQFPKPKVMLVPLTPSSSWLSSVDEVDEDADSSGAGMRIAVNPSGTG